MVTVKVQGTASEIMEIVREVRATGRVQGKDFDFSYKPAEWTDALFGIHIKAHATFTFYEEKYASFFILQYSAIVI